MSRRTVGLVADPMRATLRSATAWISSTVALVVLTVAFWPAFEGATDLGQMLEQMLDQVPAGLAEAFGMEDFGAPAGYLRGNLYDLLLPLLFGAAAIVLATALTAGEEDSGRLELVLVQPVSRAAVFGGRSGALLAWLVLLVGATALFQVASNAVFGLEIAGDRLAAALVLCGLLGALHGGLALAVAGWLPRPSMVTGLGLGVLLAGFVVAALFPLSDDLREWARLSPWDWALGGDPLVHGAEAWRYASLAVPAALLALVGVIGFVRRDVRVV
jgi:ABC-2 type transport system permease protein